MEKLSRQGFLKVAAAAAMSGVTAAGLAACKSGKADSTPAAASGNAGIYTPGTYSATETGTGTVTVTSFSQFSNICAEMPVSDAGRVISVRLRQR